MDMAVECLGWCILVVRGFVVVVGFMVNRMDGEGTVVVVLLGWG